MDTRIQNLGVARTRQQMYQVGPRESVQRKVKMEKRLPKDFAMSDTGQEIMIKALVLNTIKSKSGEIVDLNNPAGFAH